MKDQIAATLRAGQEALSRRVPARIGEVATETTTRRVVQTGHGVAVGDVIRHNGTSWVKSQADTEANAVVGGIVLAVPSADAFVFAIAGHVAGLAGLTPGVVHYLSAATAGSMTTTKPSLVVPVVHADTTTSGVLIYSSPPTWDNVSGKPATFPSGGTVSLTVDSTDVTDAAALALSGTFESQTWTFYEKRPRFNAKWLQGNAIKTGVPSANEQALLWNTTSSYWEPVTLIANAGGILTRDTTSLIEVDAGAARSVFGNPTAAAAAPQAIAASADDTVLGRRGGTLTWDKVNLETEVSGELPIENGGTGAATLMDAMLALGITATGSELVSTTSTWTKPAGVVRAIAVLVAGGGGNSTIGYNTGNMYAASTSGGATTTFIGRNNVVGGNGGSVAIAILDLSSVTDVDVTIGAGGAGSTTVAGTAGGNTSIAATNIAVTANGGTGAQTPPGYTQSATADPITFSGSSVLAAYGSAAPAGHRGGTAQGYSVSNPAIVLWSAGGTRHGRAGGGNTAGASNGIQGAVLFVY